jgi:flagellar basal body-associated protein FliL
MARDVFISHSAQDKKVAETICGALEEDGIRCWVAPRDVRPGKSFPGEITRAIQQSKVMLLIFSKHSNSSEQVLREVQLGVDCHVPIVRLRIEDITLSDDLRYYLSTPQYLDALTSPISKHMGRLEAAIRELLEQSAEESAKAAVAASLPPVEVVAKNRAAVEEERPSIKWKPFAIAAVLFLAIAAALVLAFRSGRTTETKAAATEPSPVASVQPTPTLAAPPTPTPVAVAVIPSPAATEPPLEPKPSPSPIQVNKKEPGPRNNRAWQTWMDEFVHNFIASNESNDLDLAVSFYAPNVDLFEEGKKPVDAIRRDVESYNARWPARRATIRGDVRLSEKAANHSYTASFEHDYYVENPGRGEWINGAVAVELQITIDSDGVPKIVSMKQKTLRKDKGTMQKR